ncbi:MAG: aminotransferase class V-fold PLP-dependent enzyme [Pseudomonadota bacterium]
MAPAMAGAIAMLAGAVATTATDIMHTEIYLDSNATTPVLPAAAAAALHAMAQGFGNPSSTHASGMRARAMITAVRQRAQRLLGVGAGQLMFNSGATEGIQTAVLSALCALRERQSSGARIGSLLLYGATEHKAVPEALAHWNRLLGLGLEVRALPVDQDGRHDLGVLRALAGQTALLCTMAANNETGVLSDLAGIERVLHDSDSAAYWLVDCVQALGKLALNLCATRIDYAPFSGHKLYAPKGVGMLYVRAGAPFTALMMGGGQENGLRSGTENMAGVAALGAVLAALEEGVGFASHATMAQWRMQLAASLRRALPGIVFNAPFALSLPTTLNFSVPGLTGRELLDLFDAAGIRLSGGSACSAAQSVPSPVLDAMGLPLWRSGAAIRLSFGGMTSAAEIAAACARIERCGAALEAGGPLASDIPAERRDGALRFGAGDASSWLISDAASAGCIIIDPLPALAGRLAEHVRGHGYRVLALLYTSLGEDGGAARRALAQILNEQCVDGAAGDELGWPNRSRKVTLGDGGAAPALVLGRLLLARCAQADGRAAYLLGDAARGTLVAQLGFIGELAPAALAPGLLGDDTVLCARRDPLGLICTSLRAERLTPATRPDGELACDDIAAFFAAHPHAVLVDVREPYEHMAGGGLGPGGRPAINVPLGRLASRLGQWLEQAPVPLVFFCRGGNRSAKAAACLHRLGYRQAYHVAGGLALCAPIPEATGC